MTPERWRKVDQLLEAALEREAGQRPAFLDQACGDDQKLRRELSPCWPPMNVLEVF